jgi:hypothetical protein
VSSLKHQTDDQLKSLIAWCVKKRKEHDEMKKRKVEKIKLLEAEILEHSKLSNNIGQKEAWARTYLAQKEKPYFVKGTTA